MAVVSCPSPRLVADTEDERPSGLPEGAEIFCKDTGKYYQVSSGAWVLKGVSVEALNSLVAANITSGDIPIILNGNQLTISALGVVGSIEVP